MTLGQIQPRETLLWRAPHSETASSCATTFFCQMAKRGRKSAAGIQGGIVIAACENPGWLLGGGGL